MENHENLYTTKEIFGQTILWGKVFEILKAQKTDIANFLEPILKIGNLRIILTGAGSSAFIGDAAQSIVERKNGKVTQSVPTTDITTHHGIFSSTQNPILLVSLARSGNSPESHEVFQLAEEICTEVYHLIITCDRNGKLAGCTTENPSRSYTLILPEEANDKSLAMTGSFTSMLLCILLIWDINDIDTRGTSIANLISLGEAILNKPKLFMEIATIPFERVVFLGSGPHLGLARECHLKLQELTNGRIICKFESFLGFRHGPRAVINENTLMVYLFSANPHVFKYEWDLVEDISKDPRQIRSVSFNSRPHLNVKNSVLISTQDRDHDELDMVAAVIIGQLLGLYYSVQMGLNPDNPSTMGAISRVVQGVNIYKKEL